MITLRMICVEALVMYARDRQGFVGGDNITSPSGTMFTLPFDVLSATEFDLTIDDFSAKYIAPHVKSLVETVPADVDYLPLPRVDNTYFTEIHERYCGISMRALAAYSVAEDKTMIRLDVMVCPRP